MLGTEEWTVPTIRSGLCWIRLSGGTRQFRRHVVGILMELGGERRESAPNVSPSEVCLILDGAGSEAQAVIAAYEQITAANDLPLAIVFGGEQFRACSSPKIAWLPSEVDTCVFEWMLDHLTHNGWRWSGGNERRKAPRLRLRVGISAVFELVDVNGDGAQLGSSILVAPGSNVVLDLSNILPELDEHPIFHVIHTRSSPDGKPDGKPYRLHGMFHWTSKRLREELENFLCTSALLPWNP